MKTTTMMSNLHDEMARLHEERSLQQQVAQGGEIIENDISDMLNL